MKAAERRRILDDYQELRGIWRKDPVKYFKHRIGITPSSQQQEMLEAIAPSGAKVTVRAGHGVGKAHPVSLVVDTPDGRKRWGDIKAGDRLFGKDGKPTEVLGVFDRGILPIYRVTFDDKSSTLCSSDHLWTVRGRAQRRTDRDKKLDAQWVTLSTKNLVEKGVLQKNGRTLKRVWELPPVAAVDYPYMDIPMDAYLLGLWLGDGSRMRIAHDSVAITSMDREIIDYPRSLGMNVCEVKDRRGSKAVAVNITDGGKTKKALQEMGISSCYSYQKFIPKCFLENSYDIRLAILQGLMDTDGTVTGGNFCTASFSSSSERLVESVEWLARSLGAKARRYKAVPTSYVNPDGVRVECRLSYETTMAFPEGVVPFRLKRKQALFAHTKEQRYLARWFDSIELIGEENCRCVKVSASDSLYLVNDFIVTHNTTALSGIGWWHLECFDYCRIPCTAPTASQLREVLWSEFGKSLRRSDETSIKNKLPPFLHLSKLFKITQDKIYDPTPNSGWFAVARTARRDQPDALQGFHASDLDIVDGVAVRRSEFGGNIMFIIEEASGVPDEIFTVAEGALTSHDARLIMVGNPVRSTGFFADSHLKHRANYTCLHFSVKGSPLPQPGYREGLVRKWGENSNVVRVRADGEFPKQDDNVLIPLEQAEAALERDPVLENAGRRILGVDVARFGDDRTTYVVRQGRAILHIEVHSKEDTMTTAGRSMDIARRFAVESINVDVIGVGAGVVDRLKEQKMRVVAVNVADAATLRPKTNDRRGNLSPGEKFGKQDMYPGSMRDYLWVEMAAWFAEEEPTLLAPDCDWKDHAQDLAAEVATVRYTFDSSGKIKIESKDEMKKRGLRSCDLADGLGLTFAPDRLSVWHRL